jgi:hypothetical protein
VEALEPRWAPAVGFAPMQTFAAGTNLAGMVVADFNGDGKPDLAVANAIQGSAGTVSVLLNTTPVGSSTPTFAAAQTFAVGMIPVSVAVADFNGDGKPDLAVVNENTNSTVSVLLNTTPAGASTVSFAAQQTFAVGFGAAFLAVPDFNGDGKPDLAVGYTSSNNTSTSASVLLNTTPTGASTVSFAAPQTFATGFDGPLAVGDFNGDGKPDFAVLGQTAVSVLLNTTATGASTVSFGALQTFANGNNGGQGPIDLTVGDFNGDGRPDLAVSLGGGFRDPGNSVAVLLNTTAAGASTASFTTPQIIVTNTIGGLAVGDFNGDGKTDLAFGGGPMGLFLNATAAGASTVSFTNPQYFATGNESGAPVVGDFNGDGKPDLAAVILNVSRTYDVGVFLNATVSTVVGQFGGQGVVWQYDRATGAWVQLTAANASHLATNVLGDVAGVFHNYGVWLFTPAAGWVQINGVDATALAMDAAGNIVADFPGFGVGEYLPGSGWVPLTGASAALLAISASGEVAAEFPGAGVWLNPLVGNGGGWKQINGQDATLLAIDDLGEVVANFRSVGVGQFRPATGWQVINGVQATALSADWQGNVAAQFPGFGVGQFVPGSGWTLLTAANAALLTAADGAVVGAFAGFGVWEFDPVHGWFKLTAADASLLAMG